jgi:outer membrane immunogenic protein
VAWFDRRRPRRGSNATVAESAQKRGFVWLIAFLTGSRVRACLCHSRDRVGFKLPFCNVWRVAVRSKIVTLLAAAFSLGVVQAASAADMPTKMPVKAAPMVAPVYNWTGFYVGAVGTYGWGDSQHCQIGVPVPCDPGFPQTNLTGWEGGGTIGYNWQWNQWVLGAEGDWSWGKLKGSSGNTATFGCGGGGQTCDTWINSIGTARARVGYAFDRFLPYLTAGAAFSDLNASIGPAATRSTASTTKTDFVWGGGLEYAFWQNLSAKIEYLNITKLGDFVEDNNANCGAATRCYVHVGSINLVRFGLNYKF